MPLILSAVRFLWAHRTVVLIVAVFWNVGIFFLWNAERVTQNIPHWLLLVYAAVFALFIPVSIVADRRKKRAAERAAARHKETEVP
jgi:hypothetical protein